jgi:predicted Zn-dependent protease
VVTAAAGDDEDALVRRMRGVERPREPFRALNDLNPGARIAPGMKFKVVSD